MEYSKDIQKSYALRAILNYKQHKDNTYFDYTFATTSLLAILTAVIPDDEVKIIKIEKITNIPYLVEFENVSEYFKLIRNSLAHKTSTNFSYCTSNGDKKILIMDLTARNKDYIRLSLKEIEQIIEKIEHQILNEYSFFDKVIEDIHQLRDKVLPKPISTSQIIKGIGKRRNEKAIIYKINQKNEKGITKSELDASFRFIYFNKLFSRKDFKKHFPECAKEGGCNFTTIGGIFELYNVAEYEDGEYKISKLSFANMIFPPC